MSGLNYMNNANGKDWTASRVDELRRKINIIGKKDEITYSFIASPETNYLKYIPEGLIEEIAEWSTKTCRFIESRKSSEIPKIIIASTHVSDQEYS